MRKNIKVIMHAYKLSLGVKCFINKYLIKFILLCLLILKNLNSSDARLRAY